MSFSEWKEYFFHEVTVNHDSKRKPLSSNERAKLKGKYPYYGAQGIIDSVNDYIFDGTYMLIAEDGENLRSKKQNIAQLVYGKFWVNNHAHVLACNHLSDIRYLCYLFNSIDVSGYITGSAQPKLNQANLNSIRIKLPPVAEQKVIADTLAAIDDAIMQNNQVNKKIEELSHVIFKSWFVEFEPFKEGEFEESKLGMIPKGWSLKSLDEIANFLNGLAMQKYPPEDSEKGLPVLKIKELRQGFTDENSDTCAEGIESSYIINDGDVIFSWSGSLLVDIWCGGKSGLNQHLFKVTSEKYKKWFYYLWTCFHLERFIAIARDKATTMGHIQRKHLKEAQILLPDDNTLAFMDSVMQPLIDMIIANKVEARNLAAIRDTLLPKLMSGEVRVPIEQ